MPLDVKVEVEKLQREIWRPIPSAPRYDASNEGRVRSRKGRAARLMIPQRGQYLHLLIDCRNAYVHDLVAEAFIGPKPKGWFIHHKDRNKYNNEASNLEYLFVHIPGRGRQISYKLNEEAVKTIKWFLKNRPDITQVRLAAAHNVSTSAVKHIAQGHTWEWLEV